MLPCDGDAWETRAAAAARPHADFERLSRVTLEERIGAPELLDEQHQHLVHHHRKVTAHTHTTHNTQTHPHKSTHTRRQNTRTDAPTHTTHTRTDTRYNYRHMLYHMMNFIKNQWCHILVITYKTCSTMLGYNNPPPTPRLMYN